MHLRKFIFWESCIWLHIYNFPFTLFSPIFLKNCVYGSFVCKYNVPQLFNVAHVCLWMTFILATISGNWSLEKTDFLFCRNHQFPKALLLGVKPYENFSIYGMAIGIGIVKVFFLLDNYTVEISCWHHIQVSDTVFHDAVWALGTGMIEQTFQLGLRIPWSVVSALW